MPSYEVSQTFIDSFFSSNSIIATSAVNIIFRVHGNCQNNRVFALTLTMHNASLSVLLIFDLESFLKCL